MKEFEQLSKHIGNIKKTNVYPTIVSDREFLIHGYETTVQSYISAQTVDTFGDRIDSGRGFTEECQKTCISIRLIDATGNTRKVKDITFDHWDVFTEAIAKHYGAVTA